MTTDSSEASMPAHVDVLMHLRLPAVKRLTGLGRSTIYRLMALHEFPSPVKVSKRAVAWRRTDLEQWSEARPRATH